MPLAFPSKVKYIKVQPHDRIFASHLSDHRMYEVLQQPYQQTGADTKSSSDSQDDNRTS
jgi:hypothetical protein